MYKPMGNTMVGRSEDIMQWIQCSKVVESLGFWNQNDETLSLSFSNYCGMTLSKSLNLSNPQFPHLKIFIGAVKQFLSCED